jgi:hypothetical protein
MGADTPWMIRQGDVLLISVDEIPANSELLPRDASNRVVLAYGEATGHAHALHDSGVQMLRAANADEFLRVTETAFLRHEEHKHISVPPGLYRVVRQREYAPETRSRLVSD